MKRFPSISIILPAYNAETTLERALLAICTPVGAGEEVTSAGASGRSFPVANSAVPEARLLTEIIVIDDASLDGTVAVCERFPVRLLRLTRNSGPAHARNMGARMATGELLLFLDADTCLESGGLARIESSFEADPELDGLIGAYDDEPAAPGVLSQYRNLLHCFVHRSARRRASTFWSGCGVIKTAVFLEHNGFDEGYKRASIEDLEFGYRLARAGRKIVMDPEIRVKHLKRWTFASMIRTDVLDRGIPWTELILRERFMPADLNLGIEQRLSVMGVFTILMLVAASLVGSHRERVVYLGGAFGLLLAILWLNRRFYSFLFVRRGPAFTFEAAGLHLMFYFYNGVAFLLGIVFWFYRSHPLRALKRRLLGIVAG